MAGKLGRVDEREAVAGLGTVVFLRRWVGYSCWCGCGF